MPRLDGTGPQGQGSKTGRGLGKCVDGQGRVDTRHNGRGLGLRRNVAGRFQADSLNRE